MKLAAFLVCLTATAHADDVTLAQVIDATPRAPEAIVPNHELASAEARVTAAGAWPSPVVTLGTNTITAHVVTGLSIPLPVFGTVGAARREASTHAAVVRAEAETTRRDLRRRAVLAWLALARADGETEALLIAAKQASDLEIIARGRLEAGAGAEVDVTAAHAARMRADLAVTGAKHAQEAAAAELAGVLGWDPMKPLHSAGPLPGGTAELAALRAALAKHPERLVAEQKVAEGLALENSAQIRRRPLIALEVQSSFLDPTQPGVDVWGGLAIELPLFARVGDQLRAARAQTAAERARLAAADARLSGDLVAAFRRWEAATERLAGLERDVLPAQDRAATLAQQAYKEGARDLASALQAERDRSAVTSEIAAARIDAAQTWVELQLAAGGTGAP